MKNKALQQLAKSIEQSNEEFEKMSKPEKRVQIAKDCIQRINAGQFDPCRGTYTGDFYKNSPNRGSMKDYLNSNKMPICGVCAKGGMFLSTIARTNVLKFEDGHKESWEVDAIEETEMRKYFTPAQLDLMESAFEGWAPHESYSLRYPDPKDRLVAICNDIIENKGRFRI